MLLEEFFSFNHTIVGHLKLIKVGSESLDLLLLLSLDFLKLLKPSNLFGVLDHACGR